MSESNGESNGKVHPNSLANLIPWKPGQTGNPKGSNQEVRDRIQRERVRRALLDAMDEHHLDKVIAAVFIGAALGDKRLLSGRKPDIDFFKLMIEQIQGGKSIETINHNITRIDRDPKDMNDAELIAALTSLDGRGRPQGDTDTSGDDPASPAPDVS